MWLSLLLACGPKGPQPQHLPEIPLVVDGIPVTAEVADSPAERELGLMHRDPLQPDHGMVFVYPDEKRRAFWMKNTKIPLSIAYITATGIVVHTAEMTPFNETPVPSEFPAMYALEMPKNWFLAHNVTAGDSVTGLPGPAPE